LFSSARIRNMASKDELTKQEINGNEEEKNDSNNDDAEEWELYYWQGMGGKGTVIRMCLELCGLKWRESLEGKDASKDGTHIKGTDIKGYPNFAYPIVKYKDIVISQTAIVCQYILNENGFKCDNKLDEYHSMQVALTVWDAWDEWAFKKNKTLGFDKWITNRIGSFLDVLQAQLQRNNDGKGYFFGDKICIADIFVCDLMRRYRHSKKQHYQQCKYDLLKQHCQRIEEHPQIKEFLASDRYKKTCADNQKFIGI